MAGTTITSQPEEGACVGAAQQRSTFGTPSQVVLAWSVPFHSASPTPSASSAVSPHAVCFLHAASNFVLLFTFPFNTTSQFHPLLFSSTPAPGTPKVEEVKGLTEVPSLQGSLGAFFPHLYLSCPQYHPRLCQFVEFAPFPFPFWPPSFVIQQHPPPQFLISSSPPHLSHPSIPTHFSFRTRPTRKRYRSSIKTLKELGPRSARQRNSGLEVGTHKWKPRTKKPSSPLPSCLPFSLRLSIDHDPTTASSSSAALEAVTRQPLDIPDNDNVLTPKAP